MSRFTPLLVAAITVITLTGPVEALTATASTTESASLAGGATTAAVPADDRLTRLKRAIKSRAAITLPEKMAATGGGTQLITAVTNGTTNASKDGTLTWWRRSGKHWIKVGSTPARFGANGLSGNRVEGDRTTPTGLFTLPMSFGIKANPGTKLPWYKVDSGSWWNGNSQHAKYNSWHQNCPSSVCWESSTNPTRASEHLANYAPQYNYAVLIGFNTGTVKVLPPARPSGSGIFLHVFGSGHTAGCVSVSQSALVSILRWLDPAASPHIAIGNTKTITSL